MNHILSSLPLSLQLLTLVALLAAVVLDCVPLLPVIKTSLLEVLSVLDNSEWLRRQIPKAVAWLEKREWGVRLAANFPALLQKFVTGLMLWPFVARQVAVLGCLWMGWRELALVWATLPCLYALTLFLAARLVRPRRSVPLGDGPVIVTDENCAELGLTPEQVEVIAGSDTPFKPAAPCDYTFYGAEGFDGQGRMVLAERNRPEAPDQPQK